MSTSTISKTFAKDVSDGLNAKEKFLSSKYFYDEAGDRIFQSIMRMKEYYPTKSEYEIMSMQTQDIAKYLLNEGDDFNLIEFGAGDGYKTKVLLKYLSESNVKFKYMPVDISPSVLEVLEKDLKDNMPDLDVNILVGEYFQALKELNELDNRRKVILFLGSNIGNFTDEQSLSFMRNMNEMCNEGDQVFIGFDLKKDPKIVLDAYGDPNGITKAFNLNLLIRINRELGGNFNINAFDHMPLYDPQTGTTKSFLISMKDQTVKIDATNESFHFKAWEPIHTEISQKFDLDMIENLAQTTGFKIQNNFYDCKHYYLDSLWKK